MNAAAAKLFSLRSTLVILALVGVLQLLSAYGGSVEGWLAPVVKDTRLTRFEVVDTTATRIWGAGIKTRKCNFHSIEWRLGLARRNAVVAVAIEEASKSRGDGEFSFGPWLVRLTQVEIENHSFAVVYHSCHSFWLTESRFYP